MCRLLPRQAIFLVDTNYAEGYATVSFPYEFLPLPKAGERGIALDRSGQAVCEAEIVSARAAKSMDGTAVVTMKVPRGLAGKARFFRQ